MNKYVRLMFMVAGGTFFFDKTYISEMTDQQNCDDILRFFAELMEQKKTVAVMRMHTADRPNDVTATPALINFINVGLVDITNISVYEQQLTEEKSEKS